MKRRKFVQLAGASISIPLFLKGIPVFAKDEPALHRLASGSNNDRVLVLIQLNGGNDGLNTVVPLDQLSELNNVREQVILPENSLLKVSDSLGLHPAMSGVHTLWQEGKFEIVQNVGYENQNLSHFRSTDIWTSASDADNYVGSGWLGRYLIEEHPDYPIGYPNDDHTDPLSLTVGSLVSQTCQGTVYNMGLAIRNLNNFYELDINSEENQVDDYAASELDYIRTVIRQTQSYTAVLEGAAGKGKINEAIWQNDGVNNLADQLKIVATLINGGLKTKIYVCSIAGFDTHAAQVDTTDHTQGAHSQLLSNVSEAILSFQKQLAEYGIEDKVLGMTFSEFGRRIIANNSNGTDHGYSAPHFFFGSMVNPVVHGNNPAIPYEAGPTDNLVEEFDFRSLYWSVLKDWFEVDDEPLLRIMFKKYDHVQILRKIDSSIGNTDDLNYSVKVLSISPNPATNYAEIEFYSDESFVEIAISDLSGRYAKSLTGSYFARGRHKLRFDLSYLAAGNYFLTVRNNKGSNSESLVIAK